MEFVYTGLFKRIGQYCGRRKYRSLWEKKVHMKMLLIPNGYRDRTVWVWGAPLFPAFSTMFMRLDKKWSWRNKGGYTKRNCSHFECCCSHKENGRPTRTNETPSHHTRVALKLTACFRICIVNRNIFSPLLSFTTLPNLCIQTAVSR
jgi:hypothetical protein